MNRSEKALLTAALVLAVAIFNIFDARSPIPRELPNIGGGSGVRVDSPRLLMVVVERVSGNEAWPVQSLLVRVGELAALTNRDGVAEFRIPTGVHRVVVSSLTALLPTWAQDIEVRGVETILRVSYHEHKQAITSLTVSVDYMSRRSTIVVGYQPPPLNNTFIYVGNPVIHFMDQSFYLKAFKGDGLLEWFTALETPYQGPFKAVPYDPAGGELVERIDLDDLVLYVSLAESYVPVFNVLAELVEKI
ncbi:MAG: hypothetical protein QXV62_08150 [Nitrososphaerota archaeon]